MMTQLTVTPYLTAEDAPRDFPATWTPGPVAEFPEAFQ